MSWIPCWESSAPVTALILIGRSCADTSLWLAVTMTSCKPSLSLSAALSARVAVLYKAAATAARIACRFTASASKTVDAVIEPSRRSRRDGISSGRKIIPRTQRSSTSDLPGFYPAVYPLQRRLTLTGGDGLPLSDLPPACASRNPRRTLLFLSVQVACRSWPGPLSCAELLPKP
jgi:hypothetical protein